jgi:hypothetical protein
MQHNDVSIIDNHKPRVRVVSPVYCQNCGAALCHDEMICRECDMPTVRSLSEAA